MIVNNRTFYCLIILCILFVVESTSCLAQPGDEQATYPHHFYAKDGGFLCLKLARSSIGGNFDGSNNLTDDDQTIILPKINGLAGYGLSAGGRKGRSESEVTLMIVRGQGTWRQLTKKVRYSRISLAERVFLLEKRHTQPFLEIGWGFSWLKVIDGSRPLDVNGEDFWLGDGRFFDFDWHLGAGVAYYFNPRISVRLSGSYRFTTYPGNSINGVAGAFLSPASVDANMIEIGLGTVYVF